MELTLKLFVISSAIHIHSAMFLMIWIQSGGLWIGVTRPAVLRIAVRAPRSVSFAMHLLKEFSETGLSCSDAV